MNLLDEHARRLKAIVRKYGRPVVLTDPAGPTEYTGLVAIWNDVEHALKIDGLESPPMGAKASLYFDRDSLQLEEGGEILPDTGWEATGSPNAYDPEETYKIEIPKLDRQLPGILLFLSQKDDDAVSWPSPDTAVTP